MQGVLRGIHVAQVEPSITRPSKLETSYSEKKIFAVHLTPIYPTTKFQSIFKFLCERDNSIYMNPHIKIKINELSNFLNRFRKYAKSLF